MGRAEVSKGGGVEGRRCGREEKWKGRFLSSLPSLRASLLPSFHPSIPPSLLPSFHTSIPPSFHPSARTSILPLLLPILLLAGCSKSPDLFPLEVGKSWKYTVTSGLTKKVVTLRVTGRAAVAEAEGYELQSDMGNFRVAWRDGWLLAGSLAGTRFSPPLPILSEDAKASAKWKGTVHSMGKALEATADIVQDKPTTRSKDADQGVKVTIKMVAGGQNFETESYYKPKLGLVEQTQRVDGLLTIGMRSL